MNKAEEKSPVIFWFVPGEQDQNLQKNGQQAGQLACLTWV